MSEQPVTTPITSANEFIESELHRRLGVIENERHAHVLSFWGPIFPGADDYVKEQLECRQESPVFDSNHLVVILTTLGGQVDPVQRIVETVRHFYSHVSLLFLTMRTQQALFSVCLVMRYLWTTIPAWAQLTRKSQAEMGHGFLPLGTFDNGKLCLRRTSRARLPLLNSRSC